MDEAGLESSTARGALSLCGWTTVLLFAGAGDGGCHRGKRGKPVAEDFWRGVGNICAEEGEWVLLL